MVSKQEVILRYFREGHSQRRISKDLGVSRPTVKKYIKEYERGKKLMEGGVSEVEGLLLEELFGEPKYKVSKRSKRKLTTEMGELIAGYLDQNQSKRSRGLHKQLMKKVDIWEALKESGHEIGYTTVCNYIRAVENKPSEAYIRQSYEPGEDCEFDWAEVRLVIGGKEYRLMLAVFTSAMSNYRWAKLFWRQDTASFQQAHAGFFSHTSGVYRRMIYDNMRVAIRQFVGRREKKPTEALVKLASYYQFSWRFCNAGKGNEKGHVERSVEYVRRKAFSRRDEFETIQAANEYLEQVCGQLNDRPLQGKQDSAKVLFEQERPYMYPSPVAFDCGQPMDLRVDKYSTICCGTNHYSVPDHLVDKRLAVRLYPTYLLVYWNNALVCRHERRMGAHGWYIELEHYLDTLRKKPGALAGSLALKTAEQHLRSLYETHFQDQPKVFIELLHYQRDKQVSILTIGQAVAKSMELCPHHALSLDKIKVLCEQTAMPRPQQDPPLHGAIEQASQAQLQTLADLLNPIN